MQAKTADVNLTVDMFVALSQPIDERMTVVQDDAPRFGSIGLDQDIWLHKNCDVNIILDVTDLNPDPATLAKGAHPVPIKCVGLMDLRDGNGLAYGGHVEKVFHWVHCTENGQGEDVNLLYHWKRNGLCDHTGTYTGTVTVTAIGIDP